MKYKEFKQKVEALSGKYEVEQFHDHSTTVNYRGKQALAISEADQFLFVSMLHDKTPFSHKVYMLAAEYAMTPIDKRHEEPMYVFPIFTTPMGESWYLTATIDQITSVKPKAMRLSQTRIDEINKNFTFDLNDIKQEVTDD